MNGLEFVVGDQYWQNLLPLNDLCSSFPMEWPTTDQKGQKVCYFIGNNHGSQLLSALC